MTLVALTTQTASSPTLRPSSSTASAVMRLTIRCGPAMTSTTAATRSLLDPGDDAREPVARRLGDDRPVGRALAALVEQAGDLVDVDQALAALGALHPEPALGLPAPERLDRDAEHLGGLTDAQCGLPVGLRVSVIPRSIGRKRSACLEVSPLVRRIRRLRCRCAILVGMTDTAGRVAWISIAPVKAMALVPLESAVLETTGIAGDRAFAVLDPHDRLVGGKRLGPLARIRPRLRPGRVARWHSISRTDRVAAGAIELGPTYIAPFRTRPRAVQPLIGPWSEAVSTWARQPLHLVALAEPGDGGDRGPSATLVSSAALLALAQAGGADEPLDPRRFRMTFGVDGVEAYAEDALGGSRVRVGGAVVYVEGNVGRCAVTTQDPDTGYPTFDTLHVLNETRGSARDDRAAPVRCLVGCGEPGPGPPWRPDRARGRLSDRRLLRAARRP